jgi:hypothetical protein
MKKKDKLRLKNGGKIYEVAGRWGGDIVLTPKDKNDEQCLIYTENEVKELFEEVIK